MILSASQGPFLYTDVSRVALGLGGQSVHILMNESRTAGVKVEVGVGVVLEHFALRFVE